MTLRRVSMGRVSMGRASMVALFVLLPAAAQACSGCGCTLSTDADSLGQDTTPGLRMDGRVDYIDQDQLRLGGKAAPAQDPALVEVQKRTKNTLYTLGIDYMPNTDWGVNLAIPVLQRFHTTDNDDMMNGTNTGLISTSKWTELTDIRLVGRYQGLTMSKNYGLLFGLKLPTGDAKTDFHSGPTAPGTPDQQILDRGLQPGTGTTDLLLGLSQAGAITEQWSWFAAEMWQKPLNEHADYRPGATLNANVGVRYALSETFVPQLQINAQNRWRETGAQSDRVNSGGEVVYVSPGLGINLTPDTSAYGFLQLPVYERVGGLELVPGYTASVGISHKF